MDLKRQSWFNNNLSYKVVALIIAMILWLTILGRRDFVHTESIALEYMTAPNYSVISPEVRGVSLKISGSRQALKRFSDNYENQRIELNLTNKEEGRYVVKVPIDRLELPFGVKLVSVQPKSVPIEIVATSVDGDDSDEE